MRFNPLAAAVGALLLFASTAAAASETRGYQPTDAASVTGMPVEVVLGPSQIQPQVADAGMAVEVTTNGRYSGMTLGQTAGVNLAAGLIVSVIATEAAKSAARDTARHYGAALQANGCALDIEKPIGGALVSAIGAAWPGATTVRTQLAPAARSANKLLDATAPRYVFQVSTGIAPDFSALVTTIDADAYPASAGTTQAASAPVWHDTLILVSDQHHVLPKTQADIDRLVAAENARYDALNLGPAIAMLNKDAENGDPLLHRDEYKRVKDLIDTHNQNLLGARFRMWTLDYVVTQNTAQLTDNHCAGLDAAVTQSASLIADAIASLADSTLPPLPPKDAKIDPAEAAGQRMMLALPNETFVSRRGGDNAALAFRYSYLAK